jgi:hypothetical protein
MNETSTFYETQIDFINEIQNPHKIPINEIKIHEMRKLRQTQNKQRRKY